MLPAGSYRGRVGALIASKLTPPKLAPAPVVLGYVELPPLPATSPVKVPRTL